MKKVLIVDDLPEKGIEIQEELKKLDVEIIYFARCYIDAVKFIETNEYDLIILDMTLPREIDKNSKLNTYFGKNLLFDMLSLKKFIPSIIVTRYTYFGNETEAPYLHASSFCLKNPYFMKSKEEVIEIKFDISTYRGLHELLTEKIPFYVGMIYYNPNEDTWKDNLKNFIQEIKESNDECTGNGRYRR